MYKRYVDEKTGNLVTCRLIACESALPTWVAALGVSPFAYAAEQTIVNPKTKEMVVRSRNITGSSLIQVEEECRYKADSTNLNQTHYTQTAKVTAFMPLFYRRLESYTVANFASKSHQGLEVIESFCQNVRKHGSAYCTENLAKPEAATATATAN